MRKSLTVLAAVLVSAGLGLPAKAGAFCESGAHVGDDFNGDGLADILWQNQETRMYSIWFMDGPEKIGTVGLGQNKWPWVVVATGDYNGDCITDLLWRNLQNGRVVMWQWRGTFTLSPQEIGRPPLDWRVITDRQPESLARPQY